MSLDKKTLEAVELFLVTQRGKIITEAERRGDQFMTMALFSEIFDSIITRIGTEKNKLNEKTYTMAFNKMHFTAISKVFTWCLEHRTHEFLIADIAPILTKREYNGFAQLQKFGLLYRKETESGKRIKGGLYGAPMKRIRDFLCGDWLVAESYTVDEEGHSKSSENRIHVTKIKKKGWELEYGKHKETLIPWFVQYDRENPQDKKQEDLSIF